MGCCVVDRNLRWWRCLGCCVIDRSLAWGRWGLCLGQEVVVPLPGFFCELLGVLSKLYRVKHELKKLPEAPCGFDGAAVACPTFGWCSRFYEALNKNGCCMRHGIWLLHSLILRHVVLVLGVISVNTWTNALSRWISMRARKKKSGEEEKASTEGEKVAIVIPPRSV